MSWVAVGGAVAGSVVSYGLNSAANKGSGSASGAADPFAGQRGQYQGPLAQLMDSEAPEQKFLGYQEGIAMYPNLDPNASTVMRDIMNTPGTKAGQQMEAMTAPGATFNSSDPSYKFRLEQGQQALQRSGAAKGLDGSGNIMMALQDYGQGTASTEYAAQFARLGQLSQIQGSEKQQQFGQAAAFNAQNQSAMGQQFAQLGQVYASGQNQYQNEYSRLAQLAGANSGQPGMAGQLIAQQQAGTAAYLQPLASTLTDAAKSGVSSWFGPSSGGGSSAPDASEIAAPIG